jgi:hypothetical protein
MSHTDSYLTLCIEERDSLNNYETIANRLFISYDIEQQSYVVYGKSVRPVGIDNEQYFFRSDKSSDMYKFVRFIISKESYSSYTLYNYNNMPFDLEGVDYYFMEANMDIRYELAAYDNMRIKKQDFRRNLHMLKNVYNFY